MCWNMQTPLWLRLLHSLIALPGVCVLITVHLSHGWPFPLTPFCWEMTLLNTLSKISPPPSLSLSRYICHCRVVFLLPVSFTHSHCEWDYCIPSAGAWIDEWIQNHSRLGGERVICVFQTSHSGCTMKNGGKWIYLGWGGGSTGIQETSLEVAVLVQVSSMKDWRKAVVFGMKKEEIDLRSVLEIKIGQTWSNYIWVSLQILGYKGDAKGCWNWNWSRRKGSRMMLPECLLRPVLFHFSISLD